MPQPRPAHVSRSRGRTFSMERVDRSTPWQFRPRFPASIDGASSRASPLATIFSRFVKRGLDAELPCTRKQLRLAVSRFRCRSWSSGATRVRPLRPVDADRTTDRSTTGPPAPEARTLRVVSGWDESAVAAAQVRVNDAVLTTDAQGVSLWRQKQSPPMPRSMWTSQAFSLAARGSPACRPRTSSLCGRWRERRRQKPSGP
jgi:hypothetical protein